MSMRDKNGRITPGHTLNPNGVGGFAEHPENAAKGRWKISDTPGYWLKKFSAMSILEFQEFSSKPRSELTVAQYEAMQAHVTGMQNMERSKHGLDAFKEIMDRVEGKPRQTIDQTVQNYTPPTINILVSDDNPSEEHDAENNDDEN